MPDGPIAIVERHDEPDTDILALVEKIQAWAQSGELIGLAVVTVRRGSLVGTEWAQGAGGNTHLVMSGASTLAHRLVHALIPDGD